MRRLKVWTKQDMDTLRALFPTSSTKSVAKLLGRSEGSVSMKAYELRLRKTPAHLSDVARRNFQVAPKSKPGRPDGFKR